MDGGLAPLIQEDYPCRSRPSRPRLSQELASAFGGSLLQPGDDGYEDARLVWNGIHDRHPALIARCATPDDVVAAVNFAREAGLVVAVRGGGHSAPGYATCDDGIVIDLSPMKAIDVDPVAKTARAEAGLTWGEFDLATQAHGLAVTGGRFSTTGIAGLTLGSGSGWLERKCGLTADNLLSAEVVTAAGERVTASADENADLFWGLRGGSGNFGIVTSFEYRLHDVGPIIYGGPMFCHCPSGPATSCASSASTCRRRRTTWAAGSRSSTRRRSRSSRPISSSSPWSA